MRSPAVAALVLLLPAATALAGPGDRCDHERVVERSLDAAGLARLAVHADAGSLEVTGGSGDRIEVHGRTCATSARLAEAARLHVESSGDAARVAVELPEASGRSWFGGDQHVRMDVTISLPRRLAVSLDDGSGSTAIRDVASLRVSDGSGSLEVDRVDGDVAIDDGSGSIELRRVTGAVEIRDDSGSIDVTDVGSLVVWDGSGSIDVARVRGDARIIEDGSGSIAIADVDGAVRIDEDGSGSIRVRRIAGDLVVGRDGSGSIRHSGVAGRVRIPSES